MMGTLNKYSGALGIFYACLHIYELTLGMYAHARKTHTCLHIQSTLKYTVAAKIIRVYINWRSFHFRKHVAD